MPPKPRGTAGGKQPTADKVVPAGQSKRKADDDDAGLPIDVVGAEATGRVASEAPTDDERVTGPRPKRGRPKATQAGPVRVSPSLSSHTPHRAHARMRTEPLRFGAPPLLYRVSLFYAPYASALLYIPALHMFIRCLRRATRRSGPQATPQLLTPRPTPSLRPSLCTTLPTVLIRTRKSQRGRCRRR